MPTNPATQFASYVDAAQTAFESHDTQEARRQVALAKMALAKIPDAAVDGSSIRYANALAALEAAIKDMMSAETGGIVSLPVEFWR